MAFYRNTVLNIPTEAVMSGELNYKGQVNFSGKMAGNCTIQGHLLVTHEGHWHGNIYADRLTVDGQITGNIYVSERLIINEYAVIKGDITAPAIFIRRGANVCGNLKMRKSDASVPLLELKSASELDTNIKQAAEATG